MLSEKLKVIHNSILDKCKQINSPYASVLAIQKGKKSQAFLYQFYLTLTPVHLGAVFNAERTVFDIQKDGTLRSVENQRLSDTDSISRCCAPDQRDVSVIAKEKENKVLKFMEPLGAPNIDKLYIGAGRHLYENHLATLTQKNHPNRETVMSTLDSVSMLWA